MTPLQLYRNALDAQAARRLSFGTVGAVRLFLSVARFRVRLVRIYTPGELGPIPTTPTAILRLTAHLEPETRARAYYLHPSRVLVMYAG